MANLRLTLRVWEGIKPRQGFLKCFVNYKAHKQLIINMISWWIFFTEGLNHSQSLN